MAANLNRKLVLENGSVHLGTGFGATRDALCELVFNTGMVGYQEEVSDPSYASQMVLMTYPLVGNYGMADEDYEARIPAMGAMVVREYNDQPSNFRYTKTLGEILEEHNIPAIQGVDTRQICRMIRNEGSQRALLCDIDTPTEEALKRILAYELPKDVVAQVSCKKTWYARTPNPRFNVVAVDCGIKLSIIRRLNEFGCNVTVVPYNTSAETILGFDPDGIFLSNGPGDPKNLSGLTEEVKKLCGKRPMFGICMGHQILCLANGATTFKMKFGHRGGNHPVKDLRTGKIEVTSQNHSYAIDADSFKGTDMSLTHINLLDNTSEGMECLARNFFSVQYHPESAPGPQDSLHLFKRFTDMMEKEAH